VVNQRHCKERGLISYRRLPRGGKGMGGSTSRSRITGKGEREGDERKKEGEKKTSSGLGKKESAWLESKKKRGGGVAHTIESQGQGGIGEQVDPTLGTKDESSGRGIITLNRGH